MLGAPASIGSSDSGGAEDEQGRSEDGGEFHFDVIVADNVGNFGDGGT
jgi:hypothetical protein